MFKHLISVAVLSLGIPLCASAQEPMSVERSRVLSAYGTVETVQLTLPIGDGVGTVSKQGIKRQTASALRFHFVVSPPTPEPNWGVEISDKSHKKVWSYSAASNPALEFWSDEVLDNTVEIQVFATVPVPTLRLTIDKIIVSKEGTVIKSHTVNKLKPIDKAPATVQQWGHSVARLLFVADGTNRQFVCTGFVVGWDLLLTNNHCIKTPAEMSSAVVQFDYDKDGMKPVTLRFKELLMTSPDLDFSLLRLTTNSNRQVLNFDTSINENRPLVVIQHPAGRPKEFSIPNCQVLGMQVAGVTSALTDFGHGCDTEGGSSGSPALDLSSGRVVGLHHLGFLPNNSKPVNRAVRSQQLWDFLTTNLRDSAARQAIGLPAQ
jgi:hypothetical protein